MQRYFTILVLSVVFGWLVGCTHSTPYHSVEGTDWLRKGGRTKHDGKQSEMDNQLDFRELQQYRNYPEVKKWIEYFTHTGRKSFAGYVERGQVYRPLIESILEQSELPKSLYYLAMIESGFVIHAASNKQAVGFWQFIPASTERFGLQLNSHVDERLDPIRSTWAATRYLKDLHNVFQSWFLAFSAYNTGERRILSAIMRKGTRNYWELARGSAFVDETLNYVPKFIAAAIIGESLADYGFDITQRPVYPQLQAFLFPPALSLRSISEGSGLSVQQLKAINPHILGATLPHSQANYPIWLPTSVTVDMDLILERQRQEKAIAAKATHVAPKIALTAQQRSVQKNPHPKHHRKSKSVLVTEKKKKHHKKSSHAQQRAYAEQ